MPEITQGLPNITVSNVSPPAPKQLILVAPNEGAENDGSLELTFPKTCQQLMISNDSDNILHFTVNDFDFTLQPDDTFDEPLMEFDEVNIVATGPWRCYARSWV